RRSLELDPRAAQSAADLGFLAFQRRRYADAARWYDSAVTLAPTGWNYPVFRSRVRIELGDSAGALRDAQETVRLANANASRLAEAVLAQIEARTGDVISARARLEPLLIPFAGTDTVDMRDGYELALALVAIGQPDRALDLLERVRPRGPWLWTYLLFPGFDPIRPLPRFQRLYQECRPAGAERIPGVDP
ncbi:MAG: tetratricopeptide repeat protein, partial [Gemmatimonadales bacterium]